MDLETHPSPVQVEIKGLKLVLHKLLQQPVEDPGLGHRLLQIKPLHLAEAKVDGPESVFDECAGLRQILVGLRLDQTGEVALEGRLGHQGHVRLAQVGLALHELCD